MTPTRQGRIWDEYELGMLHKLAQTHTAQQIAEMLGRPVGGVYGKANKYRIQLRKSGKYSPNTKYSDDEVIRCLKLRKTGLFASEIAAQTGIPEGTLNNWFSGFQRVHHLPGDD